jgi:pyrroline-5-carboxylate reductase
MPTTQARIAFIGGGNMARGLVTGLLADGHDPAAVYVSDPDSDKHAHFEQVCGVTVTHRNTEACAGAEVVVLCVKPQQAEAVCREIGAALSEPIPLFISIMAGVSEANICRWLEREVPLVRAMPNTPAMLRSGAIGLHANPTTTAAQRNLAEEILRAGGLTCWVDNESQMDTVTAVSGSGPAYFFLLMEALEQAGIEQGLEPETARLLSMQTALGAARMAVESEDPPSRLREHVTSPGGTTERALAELTAGDFSGLVGRAVAAAKRRAQELAGGGGRSQ